VPDELEAVPGIRLRLIAGYAMSAAASAADSRILFIGNSYTSRNNLPRLLADFAAAAQPPRKLHVQAIVAGGASLKRHWNAGLAQRALAKERWEYVVLQEQTTLPVKNPLRYYDNVRLFAPEIARTGARIVLYLNWPRQSVPEAQDALTRAVNDIAEEVDALVVPVGPAWQKALREIPGLRLYEDDGSHPTAAGSYLAACVFHVVLFDVPVRGDSVAAALRLEPATTRALQTIAWAFHTPREEAPSSDNSRSRSQ
jgi:hypothetical protein